MLHTSATALTESRQAAANILSDLRSGEKLDLAFERRVREAALDARDRRWTQELVYGMLRRRAWLDAILAARVRGGLARLEPDLTDLLRLGTYQLLYMRSVPPYAAIAQTVESAKRRHGIGASKLVNAVLRRVDREREELDPLRDRRVGSDPIDRLAVIHSHPRWLVARWIARWGAGETEKLLEANNTEAPVVLRPFGVVREQLEAMLEASDVATNDVPLVPDSLGLAPAANGNGTQLAELGAYRQGLFFVQDPAATLVTRYASIPAGARVIDLCAAPGGKALELSRDALVVVAADKSHSRLARLRENVRRLDVRNIALVNADGRQPPMRSVDAVLLDAPCTGTGTFRRHPDARWRLTPDDIASLGVLQRELLDAAATLVRPGGLLVYATCSLEPEENYAQVEAFLATHHEFRLEPPREGVIPDTVLDAGRLRVLPQRHGVDGAFAARLRRIGGNDR
ncbi:MAG TPA: 16S rRNA (cytosine(967)-C(5))-methyltransferase RsmB [Gemmatimonadaceae bacterium]|nr:16S rRNA (cytosine(967)-C(5))-methyltransferase RsmB [Gemmatimonadaceae bacterium]